MIYIYQMSKKKKKKRVKHQIISKIKEEGAKVKRHQMTKFAFTHFIRFERVIQSGKR